MRFFSVWVALASFFFVSCAGLKRTPTAVEPHGPVDHKHGDVQHQQLDQSIAKSSKSLTEEAKPSESANAPLFIPIEINNKVAEWIHFFTVRKKEQTIRYFKRGSAFRHHIERLLKENDVPQELYFLAMIESGFVQRARSRAKATGVWQFMKGTAKNYGLKVNYYVDERRNWMKSTEAAISYLKDLQNVFGSWYLSLAAYNAGEHRIVRSIMRGKTRDFWALAEGKLLPRETLNYVPKFMAAVIIGQNPKKYGIEFEAEEPWEDYEMVKVPSSVSTRSLAKVTGISLKTINKWNADLYRGRTSYSRSGEVEIILPKSELAKYEAKKLQVAKLKRIKTKQRKYANYKKSGYSIYVVRRGDTLSGISRKLNMTLRTLMKINGLRRSRIHAGQRLKYYTKVSAVTPGHYVVGRNDTLSGISEETGASVSQIKELNNLSSSRIYRGQLLRLPASVDSDSRYHLIHRGENLFQIAKKYKTSVKKLMHMNGLRNSKVFPGQRIVVK